MRSLHAIRLAFADVRRRLPSLIGAEIGVAGVSAAVVIPLTSLVTGMLIAATGSSAVSNFDIAAFLLSAPGVAFLGVLGLTFFLSRFVHESLVISIMLDPGGGVVGAGVRVVRRLRRLAGLALIECALVAAVALPLLGLAAIAAAMTLGEQDINYYLAERPPAFRRLLLFGVVLGAVGAAGLWTLSVLLSYAAAAAIFDDAAPRRAVASSMKRAWSTRRATFGAHIIVAASALAAAGVGTLVMAGVQPLVLRLAGGSTSGVIIAVALLLTMNGAIGVVIAFLTFTMRGAIIARLFDDGGRRVDAAPHPTRLRTIAAVAVATIVVASIVTAWLVVHRVSPSDRTQIIAHRGASLRAPENTMSAIDAAIEDGADVIEIDVQETADGRIIVLHDKDFMRLAGDSRSIWDLTLAEAQSIDVGARFDPAFTGEVAPTLHDVIERVRGRADLLIELKYNGHDVDLAARVVNVIRESGFEDALVMSLELRGVEEVRRLAPDIPVGYTVAQSVGDLTRLDIDFLALSGDGLTQRTISRLHQSDIAVTVWTVNDEPGMHRFFDFGVDAIITDDVAAAAAVRQERQSLTFAERVLLAFRHRLD